MTNTEDRRDGETMTSRKRRRYGAGSENEPPKKRNRWLWVGVITGIVLVFLISGFLSGSRYYRTHFSYGTKLNGESLYKKTLDEVVEELSADTKNYQLTVHERTADGGSITEVIQASDIGLELVIGDELEQALKEQSGLGWVRDFFRVKEITISSSLKIKDTLWTETIEGLQCFREEFIQEPVDAYLSEYQEDVGYSIVSEVEGNEPKEERIEEVIREAVWSLIPEIDLEDYDVYKEPHVLSDNAYLLTRKENLESYTNIVITYLFGENQEVLDGNTISQWISIDDETNEVTLDEDQVDEYVAMLRRKYDTIYRDHTFTTTYGETIVIEGGDDGGDYGWWMNYTKEAEILKEMLHNGESGERTPEYYQTAASFGENDYGDSYVEVNLTAQHLYVYNEGKMVFETDFVSGRDTDTRRTPEGIYSITYKERYARLVGEDYASPVYYWMPFNGNVGFHDASWRTSFGNDIYRSSGSHGCVNLPCDAAKEMFSVVSTGMAVIVYTLPGTESDGETTQDSAQIAQVCIDAIDGLEDYAINDEQQIKSVEWCRQFYNELGSSAKSLVANYELLVEAESQLPVVETEAQ